MMKIDLTSLNLANLIIILFFLLHALDCYIE